MRGSAVVTQCLDTQGVKHETIKLKHKFSRKQEKSKTGETDELILITG